MINYFLLLIKYFLIVNILIYLLSYILEYTFKEC